MVREAESQIDDNHKYSLSIKSKSNASHNIMHYPIIRRQKRNDFLLPFFAPFFPGQGPPNSKQAEKGEQSDCSNFGGLCLGPPK